MTTERRDMASPPEDLNATALPATYTNGLNLPPLPQAFQNKPYLSRLFTLQRSYPALKSFLRKLANEDDPGRAVVRDHFAAAPHARTPGRCFCLIFGEKSVSLLEGHGHTPENGFESAEKLDEYLRAPTAQKSREDGTRRLFILEDMEPAHVEALGQHLDVDPLVYAEQMNTWNYADSWSIQHRLLPSLHSPKSSFTLRYYELRSLKNPSSIDTLTLQMTLAVNRRRYERWRDVDVPSAGKPDRRHGFVRRAVSFWTSQQAAVEGETDDDKKKRLALGWDAVMLVDPGMAAACLNPSLSARSTAATALNTGADANGQVGGMNTAQPHATPATTSPISPTISKNALFRPRSITGAPAADDDEDKYFPARKTLILSDGQKKYASRALLWKAQDWKVNLPLKAVEHESWAYHDGCSTIVPLQTSILAPGTEKLALMMQDRDLVSPAEEQVFYWTHFAPKTLVKAARDDAVNSTYYLLKHVSQHWVNQLELINTTISRGEWFADDFQAKIDNKLSLQKWKQDLNAVNAIASDINYMRRHLNHFWRAIIRNLESVAIQLGAEAVDDGAPLALKGAQQDFLTIHYRMQPLRDRAEALNSVANDLANLRAAFRGVHDGEFSVRLSLFASVVFPLTLVASIFSMSEAYLPGTRQFWKLWAIGLPLCLLLAMGLVYGRRPWLVVKDAWEYLVFWWRRQVLFWREVVAWVKWHGFFLDEEGKKAYEVRRREEKAAKAATAAAAAAATAANATAAANTAAKGNAATAASGAGTGGQSTPSLKGRNGIVHRSPRRSREGDEEQALAGAERTRTGDPLLQQQ